MDKFVTLGNPCVNENLFIDIQRTEDTCDVVFHTKKGKIFAHAAVIFTQSKLKKIKTQPQYDIIVPEFSHESVSLVVQFMYTSTVTIKNTELYVEVISLLQAFGINIDVHVTNSVFVAEASFSMNEDEENQQFVDYAEHQTSSPSVQVR